MNTDDLIRSLAAEGETLSGRWTAGKRLVTAAVLSLAAVVAVVVMTMGVRPDLADATVTLAGGAKFVMALGLASAACASLARAIEPGRNARFDAIGIGVGLAIAAGALSAIIAPGAALVGSPLECVASILGLAILPLVALIVALRPERQRVPERQEPWPALLPAVSRRSAMACPAQWISGRTLHSGMRSLLPLLACWA